MRTVEPSDGREIAETLATAAREKLSVLTRGSGTKIDWGSTERPIDLLLSTARLSAVIAHRHGDLTVTVQAGAKLADVNVELARHRQWIPLDPPPARATIGGIVATNDSGPRRHRYGAPRDLIIGIEIARTDGRLAKGGGIVVKNVAGYDLPRLMTGSFGSLAVIVNATFKLFPVAQASRTVVVDVPSSKVLGELVSAFLVSQLTPTAIELAAQPTRLLLRFETIEASLEQQTREAIRIAETTGASARLIQTSQEAEIWEQHSQRVWSGTGCVVKVTMLPTELAPTLEWLQQTSPGAFEIAGRAGLGVFLLRIDGPVDQQVRMLNELRNRLPSGRGSAVVVRGSSELKQRVDPWGSLGDAFGLMRAVKQQFDPEGILNPGRGPGGL